MKKKPHAGPLKLNMDFDEAIRRAVQVKPPDRWPWQKAKRKRAQA